MIAAARPSRRWVAVAGLLLGLLGLGVALRSPPTDLRATLQSLPQPQVVPASLQSAAGDFRPLRPKLQVPVLSGSAGQTHPLPAAVRRIGPHASPIERGLAYAAAALTFLAAAAVALYPREPLALGDPPRILTVIGENFDSEDSKMEAVHRMYLNREVFVIDVRTPEEVAETGTLKKAVNIPHTQLADAEAQLPPYRDTPILVFCKSGYRSGIAEQILVDMEYVDVINAGGFNDIRYLDLYALYKDPRTTVIDVRTPAEVATGTLRRAVNIEYQRLPEHAAQLPVEKDAPIMVFCAAGRRAAMGADLLRGMGYTNLTNAGAYTDLTVLDS